MRPPGSAADRVGSSGNREISRRISETDPGRPRGGFPPLTLISLDLSGFGENGAYVEQLEEIRDPRARGRLRRSFVESRDFSATLRNCFRAPARWVCAIYSYFPGSIGIRPKRDLSGAVGGVCGLPGPRSTV